MEQFKEMLRLLKLAGMSLFVYETGTKKRYPIALQFPITTRCNARCEMCNIWRMDRSADRTLQELSEILDNRLFHKVKYLGINGGEPSLEQNLPQLITNCSEKLPKLRSISLITNGFATERILRQCEEVMNAIKSKNIKFHVSVSLDGIGDLHNKVRGIDGSFEKTMSTITKLQKRRTKYCDGIDAACTLTKSNLNYWSDIQQFCLDKDIPVTFRLAISNKRIESHKLLTEFSALTNQHQSAAEVFYGLFRSSKGVHMKIKYFSTYFSLINKGTHRVSGCLWKENGATLLPSGNIAYCAVESDELAVDQYQNNYEKVFFDRENLNYRKSIVRDKCKECIHDYNGAISISSIAIFIKEFFKIRYGMRYYKYIRMLGI